MVWTSTTISIFCLVFQGFSANYPVSSFGHNLKIRKKQSKKLGKADQIGMYKTDALADNLREIAPYIELEEYTERITEDNAVKLLQSANIICEAFDDAECKAMLTNTVLSEMPNKYLVAASGMAGMGTTNSIRTRRITSRLYLCGDETSEVSDGIGLVAPRVALCAAHEAHTVLRILAKQFEV